MYHVVNNMYMNIIHEWLPQIHFCAYASLTDFVPIGAPLKQFIDSELSMPHLRLSPLNNNHNLVMFFFNNPSRFFNIKKLVNKETT